MEWDVYCGAILASSQAIEAGTAEEAIRVVREEVEQFDPDRDPGYSYLHEDSLWKAVLKGEPAPPWR